MKNECEGCQAIPTVSYNLVGSVLCKYCSHEHNVTNLKAVYVGMIEEGFHAFRLHKSVRCPGCNIRLDHVQICCGDFGGESVYYELFDLPVPMIESNYA